MTKDALYLLFSAFDNQSGKCYSLGGIVKYSYTANGTTGTIIRSKRRIGIADAHTAQNGIYPTNESNFYGPVKVIGFDEQNLYIADDGVTFEKTDSGVIVKANRNSIASLSYKDDRLSLKSADSTAWNKEEVVKGTGQVDITVDDYE